MRKHGQSKAHIERFFCTSCKKTFQSRYIYSGSECKVTGNGYNHAVSLIKWPVKPPVGEPKTSPHLSPESAE